MPQPRFIINEGPMIHLVLDDVEIVQVAGVQFDRALAGAPTMALTAALSEQEQILQQEVERAGFATSIACVPVAAFTIGTKLDGARIVSATMQGAVGTA